MLLNEQANDSLMTEQKENQQLEDFIEAALTKFATLRPAP
jgi:hypothetical protein